MESFSIFIAMVAIIVVIIIVVRKIKRRKAIEDLEKSAGYEVAKNILDKLTQEGFKVDYKMEVWLDKDIGATGSFDIWKGTTSSTADSNLLGVIYIAIMPLALKFVTNMALDNALLGGNQYKYAIQNDNIGLLVLSRVASKEVPPFIKIAASVIKDSGYVFKHPELLYEDADARKYLNVMFQ